MICHMMGLDELLEDPALRTGMDRVANYQRIDEAMAPWLRAHTVDEAFHTAQSWRIPFAPVLDAAGIYASPQLAAREWFSDMEHPEAGSYRAPGPAVYPAGALSSERTPDRAAPALGRDNAAEAI